MNWATSNAPTIKGEGWRGPTPCTPRRVFEEFNEPFDPDVQILLAWYDDPYGYSGEAFVLFCKDGVFYTVHGSHCSCYGLEGQWTPVRTSIAALKKDLARGEGMIGDKDYYYSDLMRVVGCLEVVAHD